MKKPFRIELSYIDGDLIVAEDNIFGFYGAGDSELDALMNLEIEFALKGIAMFADKSKAGRDFRKKAKEYGDDIYNEFEKMLVLYGGKKDG